MKIIYSTTKVEKLCENPKKARQKLGDKTGIKLMQTINFIEAATSFEMIMNYPPFNYHKLKGDLSNTCSLDIEGRKSKWRLYVKPIDANGKNLINEIDCMKSEIIHILIEEVKDHG